MTSLFAVDGLISGLRTNEIVSQMLELERRPLTALQSRRALEQQRADALRDIATRLSTLQAKASTLTLRGTVNAKTASSSASASVTGLATADAANGAYQVSVTQLATSTRVSSSAAVGSAVVRTNSLATAGFGTTPTSGTFTINGVAVTVADASATILDDGNPGSLVDLINSAGAGVTASIVADPDGRLNRFELVSDAGGSIQLGAGADTSNLLSVLKISGALVTGATASSVDGTPVAAGAVAADFTVNGVQVTVNTDPGNTAAQNAEELRLAINAAGAGVTAAANPDDSLTLTHDTLGSAGVITIAGTVTGTGLSVGVTQDGADKVTSSGNLAGLSAATALTSADARLVTPLAGLDADNNGSFKINGVSLTFNGGESLNTVISRINSSSAGVTARYDSLLDQVSLTAGATGTALISVEDVTGNFLAAAGLIGATQTVGQNAVYTIDAINGGQALSSSSNTVSGVLPGVTLNLKAVTDSPVTITVSQDTATTVAAVQAFVAQYNSAIDFIHQQTGYDATLKKSGLLAGESSVLGIEARLRRLISTPAVGAVGSYTSLADLGVTTGAIGSAVGTANTLTLDDSKLTAALSANPSTVEAVLRSFSNTAVLSGGGPVTSVVGAPTTNHEAGRYEVVSVDGSSVSVTFYPDAGGSSSSETATLGVGDTNVSLIPGVTLTGSGVAGTSTITVAVQARGVSITVNDYLRELTGSSGLFASRSTERQRTLDALDKQAERMEERLATKEEQLRRRFRALESALSRLQTQSNQLSAQLLQFSSSAE